MRIDLIAGARPNFMKIASIIKANEAASQGLDLHLVHTGQHYDKAMSETFFTELGIPEPDVNLEVGSASQAEQTGLIMTRYEAYLEEHPADVCLVVGDVTSTMACSIVAKKAGMLVAHIEGGLRSRDWAMPEEVNRVVTDSITDIFFTTSVYANENLMNEGVDENRIHFVGNTMIDTLVTNLARLRRPPFWEEYSLTEGRYVVLTLHRPSNVDDKDELISLLELISEKLSDVTAVFPVHPRTAKQLEDYPLPANMRTCNPLGYLEFNYLVKHAMGVVTDSAGVTEEATYLNIPSLTLRTTTERPETVSVGSNVLAGDDRDRLASLLTEMTSGNWKKGEIPEKWDGRAGERIVAVLETMAQQRPWTPLKG